LWMDSRANGSLSLSLSLSLQITAPSRT
jgi:hypothetical protein